MAVCRPAAAACRGMLRIGLVERAFTWAPLFNSSRAASIFPKNAARCSGVQPSVDNAEATDRSPASNASIRSASPWIAAAKIASDGSAATSAVTREDSPARTAS